MDYLQPISWFDHRGVRLAFTDTGEKEPALLFLHGYGSAIVEWDSHVARLSRTFRCLNLDLPGHGESSIPASENSSLQSQVDAVAAFLDYRRCPPVIAIGHSMGGRIAGWLTLRYPGLVRALILVNAPADQPLSPSLKLMTRLTPTPAAAWLMAQKIFFRILTRRYSSDMVRTQNELTRRKADYLRYLRGRPDFPGRIRFLIMLGKSILKDELDRHLAEISLPTLVVWADNDHTCPVSSAQLIADRVPGARLHILPDSAHNPHLEHFEQFNELILEFIASLK